MLGFGSASTVMVFLLGVLGDEEELVGGEDKEQVALLLAF